MKCWHLLYFNMYWTYRVRSCDIHMQVLRLSQCREICINTPVYIERGNNEKDMLKSINVKQSQPQHIMP